MSTDDDSGFLSFYSLLLTPYRLSQTSELFGVLAGLGAAVEESCCRFSRRIFIASSMLSSESLSNEVLDSERLP